MRRNFQRLNLCILSCHIKGVELEHALLCVISLYLYMNHTCMYKIYSTVSIAEGNIAVIVIIT